MPALDGTATIGVDFKVKVIERNGKRWKLSIWVRRSRLPRVEFAII
jgi:hypothetical protein